MDLEENGCQAQDRVLVGEDADDIGSPLDLDIDPDRGFVEQILRQWTWGKAAKAQMSGPASRSMAATAGNWWPSLSAMTSSCRPRELLIFAMVFDLPILWFLLLPQGDHRLMPGTTRQVDELLIWLLGRPEKLEPLHSRLRELGMHDPTEAQLIVEKLTGQPADSRAWSYKERRKEMLLALLDNHADEFDNAVEELGRWVDHLRQAGIRGFIAEHTWDVDFTRSSRPAAAILDETAPDSTEDETASGGRRKRGRSVEDDQG